MASSRRTYFGPIYAFTYQISLTPQQSLAHHHNKLTHLNNDVTNQLLLNCMFRWSKIAKHLPGRTDNEIKNFWRTRIQKYIKQADVTTTSSVGSHHSSEINDQVASTSSHNVFCTQDQAMETYSPTPTSYQHTNMEFNYGNYSTTTAATDTVDYPIPMTVDDQTGENYWGMDDIWSSMHLLNGN